MSEIYLTTDETGRAFLQQDGENGARTSWNFGADPVESLRAAEAKLAEINANGPCVECGGQRVLDFETSCRTRLIEQGVCFSCLFWRDKVNCDLASLRGKFSEHDRVVVDGRHFLITPDDTRHRDKWHCGHGGAEFIVQFNDGRRVVTHNLWSQGRIPAHFRERLPDNATFVKRSASGYRG